MELADSKASSAKQSSAKAQRAPAAQAKLAKKGNATFEYAQSNPTLPKTNRSPVGKQSQKQKSRKIPQVQDTSDDIFSAKVLVMNAQHGESDSRIDLRTTEVQLLGNEIGHLREKLDRLIKNFDFKLFSKLGQVSQPYSDLGRKEN